jgi:hypothetical protein
METVAIHCLWFLFGAATMFVLMLGLAPVMLSSRISQELEGSYGQGDADVAVDAGDGGDGAGAAAAEQLKQAEERADFYYRLYSEK